VKGSSAIARNFGVSALVVGLTVVAFGTSAPELFVSVNASMKGPADVSIGNVVGSNTFNILVIIGLAAWAGNVLVAPAVLKREMPIMLAVMLLFIGMSFDGELSRLEGAIMFAGIVGYLLMNYLLVKRMKLSQSIEALEAASLEEKELGTGIAIVYVIAGLIAMVFGADWIVDNAVLIAKELGVPDLIIGITLIAVGTSLPEVAATVVAVKQGQADLALGNAIGSNVFNVLCVLGITALISPLSVSAEVIAFDNWVMLAACLLAFGFMKWRGVLSRLQGGVLLTAYVGYVAYLVIEVLQHPSLKQ
jgi:cation:H+ antiporter